MKHNNKSKKHYNIRKSKGKRKTNKMKMKGGAIGTEATVGYKGFSLFGTCPDKQIYENGEWKTQTCYQIFGFPVYKTVENNNQENGAANGTTNEKPWWQFW